ncbi:MAG: CcoQ/FixQ family Cbb3-type cytochrome c oxidase assembly chaperone [Flavobacteriales bacterium]|nr:CcoQ/FixQ family Cbb3-type cytochrome c oxidase assembly chaperone [Flavobacteriales bacterium]NQX97496.1 CcoQ/FixQ family Cbb3-type cytochrome c oxidase assembly chaperone [Flavobacteriales bacterium]
MLRFINGNLTTIDGIEIFPLISLVIFTVFFIGLFWWVFTAKKSYIKEMEEQPLND